MERISVTEASELADCSESTIRRVLLVREKQVDKAEFLQWMKSRPPRPENPEAAVKSPPAPQPEAMEATPPPTPKPTPAPAAVVTPIAPISPITPEQETGPSKIIALAALVLLLWTAAAILGNLIGNALGQKIP